MDTFLKNYIEYCNQHDNHYQVEIAALSYIPRFTQDEYPYLALARLANKLGLNEHVELFLKRALSVNSKAFQSELYQECLQGNEQAQSTTHEKYLVINSWSAGLGADILYAVGWLYCAALTKRQPLIYWGDNSVYNESKNTNLFPKLFKGDALTDIGIAEKAKTGVFPEYWNQRLLTEYYRNTKVIKYDSQLRFELTGSQYLNRTEPVLVSGEPNRINMMMEWALEGELGANIDQTEISRVLIKKYFQLADHLQAEADQFITKWFEGMPYLAIHLRGTDKIDEGVGTEVSDVNQQLIDMLEKEDDSLPIFLMTDDKASVSEMIKRFPGRIYLTEATRGSTKTGIHFEFPNKLELAEEVLIDVAIASKAQAFYGFGSSSLAVYCSYLRSKDQKTVIKPFDLWTRLFDLPTPDRLKVLVNKLKAKESKIPGVEL